MKKNILKRGINLTKFEKLENSRIVKNSYYYNDYLKGVNIRIEDSGYNKLRNVCIETGKVGGISRVLKLFRLEFMLKLKKLTLEGYKKVYR